jgi:hypothetical protein
MQARLQSLPCYHNGGGNSRRFTPLEAGLVQEGTDFLMEEYTFRLSLLYFLHMNIKKFKVKIHLIQGKF